MSDEEWIAHQEELIYDMVDDDVMTAAEGGFLSGYLRAE